VPATPSISVLLPVYNGEEFLEECLGSLTEQSLEDFEVVAVDDGSTDATAVILKRWSDQDTRFRVLARPHSGLVETLNTGLANCRGEFVARMDADDRAHSRRFEMQLRAFDEDPDLDVVACLVSHFPDETLRQGLRIYEAWLNSLVTHDQILRERFIESPIPHPAAMVRRSVLDEAGGYREVGFPEDYDLWLRLAAAGKRFGKVPETLYYWRHHEARLTFTDPRYAVERFLACKAHHLAEGPLRGVERVIVWGSGQTGRRLSKHLIREGASVTGFIDIDPAKIGGTLRGRPIHPPEKLQELLRETESRIVLAAVSSRGARALIRQQLEALGLLETVDFWCVA
jgi:glycosyltransferase involved in cell wall biosynthesis